MTKQKISKKRQAMEEKILEAIHFLIQNKGLNNFGARDIAKQAECSVGSIYTTFEDFDNAIFVANSLILHSMDETLSQVSLDGKSPKDILKDMAKAYAQFAIDHQAQWKAVFFHKPQHGIKTPDWYLDLHTKLILRIIEPLQNIRPDLNEEETVLRAKTMFAATHGVVQLAMEERFVGVPLKNLVQEVEALVDAMTRGLETNT